MFDKNNYAGLHYYINQDGEKRLDKKLIDEFKKIGEHSWRNNDGDEFPWWTLENIRTICKKN